MATLMLRTVIEKTSGKYQLKLLAGEEGLHRSLRWLYFSEDIGNADFFRGGELMLLTGHKFKARTEFESFVKMLIERNSCGIIIPVGKYLQEQDITEELLELCDREQFPLFIMPWNYFFTDLMQDLNRLIFANTQKQELLAYTFQSLLKHTKLYSAEDAERLLASQYNPSGEYCVAILSCHWSAPEKTLLSALQNVKSLIENHLNQWPEQICVFVHQTQIILVFHNTSCRQIGKHMENILRFCKQTLPSYSCFCGIGAPLYGIETIKESFERACIALQYGRHYSLRLSSFDTIGVFQLLYICRNDAVFDRLVQVLKPLIEYDEKSGGQLVETLRLYLYYNGSVNHVSEEMYCHRNTTNYRLKKIKSILDFDLEDRNVFFRLQMGIHVLEYRKIFDLVLPEKDIVG